ncbi:MAG: IS630 family transposase [Leptolyngbyaceae cyanobacterium]
MSGIYHLEITETLEDLKTLRGQQKTATDKDRVHLLYLLKSAQAQTMEQAALLLGRHRVTVQKWARRYREGGMAQLLSHKPRVGRQWSIPGWAQTALRQRLEQSEGFERYGAICQWLETELGIVAPYKTVHRLVHDRLQAAPKVVRPQSAHQDEARLENYKKKLPENLAMLAYFAWSILGWSGQVRFFCGDESRFGLKTLTGRKITTRGVKPQGQVQWPFQATYLYGIVEPATGEHFFYEFTHCNTDCFEAFLQLVAKQYADSILIIQLDQAGWHRAKRLQVPDNLILMFQPPHCPECNPIEQVWQYLKKRLRWRRPQSLTALRDLIRDRLLDLTPAIIASITGRKSILEALSVAGI